MSLTYLLRRAIVFFAWGLCFSVVPTSPTVASGESLAFNGFYSTGCNASSGSPAPGTTALNLTINIPQPGTFYFDTIVESGGGVFTDWYFGVYLTGGSGGSVWGLSGRNDRGRQTASYPLPPNTNTTITIKLLDSNQRGIWQLAVTFVCNTGNVISVVSGPIVPTSLGDRAADLARQVQAAGTPYRSAGKGWQNNSWASPTDVAGRGLDCSGLIMWAYNRAAGSTKYFDSSNAVNWESADQQFHNNFQQAVAENDLAPGDAIFFDWDRNGRIDHVAMFVGSGQVAHAPEPGRNLELVAFSEVKAYWGGQQYYRRISAPSPRAGAVRAHSPVHLNVTDPDGVTITATTMLETTSEGLREVLGSMSYAEWDFDTDGEDDDQVTLLTLKVGEYIVQPVPKPGADPSDTFTLDIEVGDSILVLAQDVRIQDIPTGGYRFYWSGTVLSLTRPQEQNATSGTLISGLCPLAGGGTNAIVTVSAPPNAVSGGSVFCRIINQNGVYLTNSAEIGNGDIINQGVLQAVDVFGLTTAGQSIVSFNSPIQICLQGQGGLLFLNATNQPRTVERLASAPLGNYTCGSISNSGTLVLVPSETAVEYDFAPLESGLNDRINFTLNACSVETQYRVNLREEPNPLAPIIAVLPFDTTYVATARAGDWFRIIYEDTQGWVNGELLGTTGDCGN